MSKQSGKVGQLEEVVEVEETEDAEKLDEDREIPRRNRSPSRVQVQETICEAYKKRECQHGLTGKRLINGKPCPHSHPPRCFRWCKHGDNKKAGCAKGSDCTYYHPKLCKNSVLKRYCANRECTFHHLKHTRRPREQLARETRGDNNPSFTSQRQPAPVPNRFRWDSVSTLNDAACAPTIEKRAKPDMKDRKLSTAKSVDDQTDTFLLQLLENMKQGIVLQLSQKMTEFQETIPSLVRDQIQM